MAASPTNRELSGFGSHFASEAVAGALPVGQNSPQAPPFGLYAEQLSGTAFTCPRATNQRSWLYRIAPSVGSSPSEPMPSTYLQADFGGDSAVTTPKPLRWRPPPLPSVADSVTFVDGLRTMCGAGSPELKEGVAIHMYAFNAPMVDSAFSNADGDLLIVPQLGALDIVTEFGKMAVAPREVCVVPRNVRFAVSPASAGASGSSDSGAAPPHTHLSRSKHALPDCPFLPFYFAPLHTSPSRTQTRSYLSRNHAPVSSFLRPGAATGCRGYVLETFSGHFRLPDLGPIGANGLAEPRDFVVSPFDTVSQPLKINRLGPRTARLKKVTLKILLLARPHSKLTTKITIDGGSPSRFRC